MKREKLNYLGHTYADGRGVSERPAAGRRRAPRAARRAGGTSSPLRPLRGASKTLPLNAVTLARTPSNTVTLARTPLIQVEYSHTCAVVFPADRARSTTGRQHGRTRAGERETGVGRRAEGGRRRSHLHGPGQCSRNGSLRGGGAGPIRAGSPFCTSIPGSIQPAARTAAA